MAVRPGEKDRRQQPQRRGPALRMPVQQVEHQGEKEIREDLGAHLEPHLRGEPAEQEERDDAQGIGRLEPHRQVEQGKDGHDERSVPEDQTRSAEAALEEGNQDLVAPARVDVRVVARRVGEWVEPRPAVAIEDVLACSEVEADVQGSNLTDGQHADQQEGEQQGDPERPRADRSSDRVAFSSLHEGIILCGRDPADGSRREPGSGEAERPGEDPRRRRSPQVRLWVAAGAGADGIRTLPREQQVPALRSPLDGVTRQKWNAAPT